MLAAWSDPPIVLGTYEQLDAPLALVPIEEREDSRPPDRKRCSHGCLRSAPRPE